MNIVVLMKQVPDTWAERKLDSTDNTLDRAGVDAVINEIDEYALEEALLLKEAHGGEVTVLTMGPEGATASVRKALSMGVDKGVQITDPALHGSCAIVTAKVLAKALETLEYDLVIAGSEATDSRLSIVPALIAEALDKPQLTGARKVTVEGSTVSIERTGVGGYTVVEASTPAVLSVLEKINEPRYPSFKGIMAAKSKPLTNLTLADLGISADEVGLDHSTNKVRSFVDAPPRAAGVVITDDGTGAESVLDYLAQKKLV